MRRKPRPGGGRQIELVIESIGARGDGIGHDGADRGGRPVFVPATLPGDRVRVRVTGERSGGLKAQLLELIAEGPGRVEPPCPHFGPCGGCALQHVEPSRYEAWKSELIVQALRRRGFAVGAEGVEIAPLLRVPPGSRRRVGLAARRGRNGLVTLGFHGRESHELVDISTCGLLTPRLLELLPTLRQALPLMLAAGEAAQLMVKDTETGPDLLWTSARAPDLAGREALADLARQADLARLSWQSPEGARRGFEPEPVIELRAPRVTFGRVAVVPPPGGFLQPTTAGEAEIVRRLRRYLPDGTAQLADLYAGCGTFALALAGERAGLRVHAVEADQAALAALSRAAQGADMAGRITVEQRDLARRPLEPAELARFDAVIFDPPRAGAREQAERIAQSKLESAIAVSCHPNSFARDARILADGGFTLLEVAPIDQFPWSGHLELVALFRR